jgi:hypothetical protein
VTLPASVFEFDLDSTIFSARIRALAESDRIEGAGDLNFLTILALS